MIAYLAMLLIWGPIERFWSANSANKNLANHDQIQTKDQMSRCRGSLTVQVQVNETKYETGCKVKAHTYYDIIRSLEPDD